MFWEKVEDGQLHLPIISIISRNYVKSKLFFV